MFEITNPKCFYFSTHESTSEWQSTTTHPKFKERLNFLKKIRVFIWKLEVKTARRIKITNYPQKRKRKSSIWHLWIKKASKKRKEESDENSETFHVIMVL